MADTFKAKSGLWIKYETTQICGNIRVLLIYIHVYPFYLKMFFKIFNTKIRMLCISFIIMLYILAICKILS